MERIRLVDGDTELLPGLELIETSGHVPGHQSVLVRLPKTGPILLTIDAVPFAKGFTRDVQDDGSDPDAKATRASTLKLLDLVEREHIGLVIFGHDTEQWKTLKKRQRFTSKGRFVNGVKSEKGREKADTKKNDCSDDSILFYKMKGKIPFMKKPRI